MGVYAGGVEYAKAYAGGREFTGAFAGGARRLAPATSDQPGTLRPNVSRAGRASVFASTLTDPDGIRSVDASFAVARDGTRADINWMRRDANTFTHALSRRNARWVSGTMTVTYTDGNGVQSTLMGSW